MSITPTFQGEVQFRRWSDSSTQGVQVTFSLPDSESLEPLKHKAGKRFMAVLVEIGDDEEPVQPPKVMGPLCREAVSYCQMEEFQEWTGTVNEEEARRWILHRCQVDSRKELDLMYASGLFKEVVRVPFMKHMKARKETV